MGSEGAGAPGWAPACLWPEGKHAFRPWLGGRGVEGGFSRVGCFWIPPLKPTRFLERFPLYANKTCVWGSANAYGLSGGEMPAAGAGGRNCRIRSWLDSGKRLHPDKMIPRRLRRKCLMPNELTRLRFFPGHKTSIGHEYGTYSGKLSCIVLYSLSL